MLHQSPEPGSSLIMHAGDTLALHLRVESEGKGSAWLRTNIQGCAERRQEIIGLAEADTPPLERDWFDVPMKQSGESEFEVTVPVFEPGFFQAKAFFLPENASQPLWPEGANVSIKVEPPVRASGNSIYSAFVRLFGESPDPAGSGELPADSISKLDEAGYTVIPKSGKFRDLIKRLDCIIGEMRFRNLLLLPIHPTPTTYARMGRFGSPFAAIDLMDVDPALAEFDKKTTPLDQFRELIDAVHARGAYLFMDMPLNHTGWASALQIHHPSWFHRDKKRQFQSPGAWGVTWEDLAELNYSDKGLWKYMADVFLYWCSQGVDGFRCDAGYMVPAEVWEYITAKVRQQFPDTVFLLEGLGGKKRTMRKLLTSSNLDWAYSELFQNYDRSQIESYIPEAEETSRTAGLLVHFAETHDNNRLAATSKEYATMRTALSALLSHRGAFGITCGVEWFAEEKIVVHEKTGLNWGSEENQVAQIRELNEILSSHPAFSPPSEIRILHCGNVNAIAALRTCPVSGESALILANLDQSESARLEWNASEWGRPEKCIDLLSGKELDLGSATGLTALDLAPCQIVCASKDTSTQPETQPRERPEFQSAKAIAIELTERANLKTEWTPERPAELARELLEDADAFHAKYIADDGRSPLVRWTWPTDTKRTVPVPASSHIIVRAPLPFRIDVSDNNRVLERRSSLKDKKGCFAILTRSSEAQNEATLEISVYEEGSAKRTSSSILVLHDISGDTPVSLTRTAAEIRRLDSSALCTNGRGAMALVRGAWGEVRSQYDALLAANLHPDSPCDRHVMLTRCRAWLVLRGFSQEINLDCLQTFSARQPEAAEWNFSIPSGMGRRIKLRAMLQMIPDKNAINMDFMRLVDQDEHDLVASDTPVKLILRFDVEDRSFHTKTKAFSGPESSWPGLTNSSENGFVFAPAPDRRLTVSVPQSKYTVEPEWSYMVGHPLDLERGLDGSSDLFSPGYFAIELKGGDTARVTAAVNYEAPQEENHSEVKSSEHTLSSALKTAMSQFVVARDNAKTVIAGYPWFLDWGRDTLICLRGMIACGMIEESQKILEQFASFEDRGTIPNMIRGEDVSNRDTSDAPLWMHTAAADLIEASGNGILNNQCGGRPLKEVLVSIAENYLNGTPNGIYVDPESGLVFSPSHYTWMDTNHPAGTPREGYPVEIQALWFRCLSLLEEITDDDKWRSLSDQVRTSLSNLFYREELGYFSDCLHCATGTPAANAKPDDHLRPNQLFAITLGAVNDRRICENVLNSCQELLVPGGIRSLADRPVSIPLPVMRDGQLLNNPERPYWGSYSGDEDSRRKPAYHNGTAWTWPMPSYCEALLKVYGASAAQPARAYLAGCMELLESNCIGQMPELTDGDSPHSEKGCTAQAWGVSEFARVLALIDRIIYL